MPAASKPRHSRRWIGFFVVLAVLAVAAIIVPLAYNLSVQLRQEQFIKARQRWQENAIPNYDLEYLVKTTHGDQDEERAYLVQVRDEKVVLAMCDNEVVYLDPSFTLIAGLSVLVLSSANSRDFGVPALFDQIETTLRQDEISDRRSYATAEFDPKTVIPFTISIVYGARENV